VDLTGYDASAHVAEETVMARLNSAWGVFLSVAVSFVVGYVMLLTLTLAIPNGLEGIAAVIDPANSLAVLYIVYQNFDNALFSNIIAVIIGVAMWLSAQQAAQAGRIHHAQDGAVESARAGAGGQCAGAPVDRLYHRSLLDSAQ
jgi:hypothetical protein